MNTISFHAGRARTVAHRGVSGIECENTMAAFIAAGNRSHFGIETDVHRTRDGKFVVFHDDSTGRLAGQDLTIEETDFDVLRALPLRDKDGSLERTDLRIPTLAEYISVCRRYDKAAVLELKNRIPDEDIARIVDIIRDLDWLPRVIFISFQLENLVTLRRLLPDQKLQYLVEKADDVLLETLLREKLDLDIEYSALTREWVRRFLQAGIEVNCWTCDDPLTAEQLARWGVQYITSNILEGR